ncbi:PAS domain S-box protein [Belnapia rosea]|uniref:PAS domain S-box protein n=1 Tax=Belnapia rosea TaxID=938405 RepID=UPI00087FEFC4|nr:PAS domain S-box protein [Belnapia rosea]SDB60921.1 PAS domain S-box-containing protein [Belnapia rosea]
MNAPTTDGTNRRPPTGSDSRPIDAAEAEAARLSMLRRYAILDTPAEAAFDRLAMLACDLLGTPMAMVSLIDETRQWFKARIGTDLREVPRELAFCDHTIRGGPDEVLVVPDLKADPRFASNPLVAGDPCLRFYAGAPLVGPGGEVLGTVSVLSSEPRPEGLSGTETRGLRNLAAMATDELELRLQSRLSREAAVRAEAARAAEERLRRAQEAAGVVAFEIAGRGRTVVGVAPRGGRLRQILGLPPGALLSLRHVLAVMHPEDRPALVAEARRLTAAGGEFRLEFRIRSGLWLQARGKVEASRGEDRMPVWRVSGAVHDITERKEMELALREAELRQRTLFEAAPFGVIVIDPATHRILDVNGRVCAEYGYTREELLRLSIADIDALGDSEAIRVRGRMHAIRPGTQEVEARHRTKSGEIRDVLVRAQGVVLGGRDVTYGAHIDITARKAAEAALRESEAEFRAAFEQASVPMSEVDCATGCLLRVNAAYARLVGRPVEEIVGRPFSDFVHPDDRAEDLEEFQRVCRGEAPGHEVAKRYVRPDGSVRWTELTSAPVCDDAGRIVRTVAIVQDVTERRAAEERQALLVREVDHRAKNVLAVVQAALRLTPKGDTEAYAKAVEGRVMALARAHTLLAAGRWTGARLRALLESELAAFLSVTETDAGGGQRAELHGPDILLPPTSAQALSIALHELATNAIKHGALSAPGGRISVSWRIAGETDRGTLWLRWSEAGGPPVAGQPERRGFGSRVIEATIRDQLGGMVRAAWEPGGLIYDLTMPLGHKRGE